MREPRPEDFSTQAFTKKADRIDMAGIVPLRSKAQAIPTQKTTEDHAVTMARQHDGMTASHYDGLPSGQHDNMTASQHDGMTAEQFSYIFSCLSEKATQKTTVRLPAELLERLEELLYTVKKSHHLRLSMNSIFVATLAFFCAEFEKLGEQSTLFQELKKFYDELPS